MCFTFAFGLITTNNYRLLYTRKEIDLYEIIQKHKNANDNNSKIDIENHKELLNPFEAIENKSLEKNFDEIMLKNLQISLYNTPLTNKLYPKSNLYGHELIRYFDF